MIQQLILVALIAVGAIAYFWQHRERQQLRRRLVQVQPRSLVEPDTGLWKWDAFSMRLEPELKHATRHNSRVWLSVWDGIEDTIEFGRCLRSKLGVGEFGVRMTHQSVIVVQREATLQSAADLAATIAHLAPTSGIRAGSATFPDEAADAMALLQRALAAARPIARGEAAS